MRHGRPLLLLLISLCLGSALVAGCGGDDETDTVTVTTTGTETTETSATTESTESTETSDQQAGGASHFQTPSGNIGCYVDVNAARCDIAKRTWKPTPDENGCTLDYGQGIIVTHDRAEFVCAGDTTLGGSEILDYGQKVERGEYVCESEPDGVTCSETETGHGFFISRQSFRIF